MREFISKGNLERLSEALTLLHYSKIKDDGTEWRCGRFHLFIRRKGKRLVLSLHADVDWSKPPYHRSRREGSDLELEMQKIVDAYKKKSGRKK